MKFRLVLAVLAACAIPAAAADNGAVSAGYGLMTCAQFSQAYLIAPRLEDSYFNWAQGFMSGVNSTMVATKQPSRDINKFSTDRQKKDLRTYCTGHPTDAFQTAVAKELFTFPAVPAP